MLGSLRFLPPPRPRLVPLISAIGVSFFLQDAIRLVESLTTPESASAHDKLSDREMQTLVMIASGKRLSDIAEELTLSPKTVSVYRARVLEKLQLANNSELTVYAIRNGLVGS